MLLHVMLILIYANILKNMIQILQLIQIVINSTQFLIKSLI